MYGRKVDGRTLTFGHEGVLYKRSFVMYDKETGSLWIHTLGEAAKGKLKGKQLEFLPSVVTTWKSWRADHPGTTVLTGRRARGQMGAFDLARDASRYGFSLGQGRKVKLYPFAVLREKLVLEDEHDGKKVVVFFDPESLSAAAFERGERTFRRDGEVVKDEQGRTWSPRTGTAGDLRLKALPGTPWLIERWKGFHPEGAEYRPPAKVFR